MILVIDNYDSFTYNLVQYLAQAGAEVVVRRNDEITLDEVMAMKPAGIMLSPGPCTPSEAGVCRAVSQAALSAHPALGGVPIFGVCLGHQTLGDLSGGAVRRARKVMHGKSSLIEHDGKGLFAGMPNPFRAIRYHSLVVDEASIPEDFIVTARSTDDNEVQGMRHKTLPIEGVQFHPESIMTEQGMTIVENFVRQTRAASPA